MRAHKLATAAIAAMMLVGLAAPGASAAPKEDHKGPNKAVIDGREYGPKEGYNVTTESFPVKQGEDPLEVLYGNSPSEMGSQAAWGSSYATSQEILWLTYLGKAKAAGNVYSGQRIIQVCIRYSYPGKSSPTVCSNASSNGSSWSAGAEQSLRFVDNLSVNWPSSTFHISTSRIAPNIY